jgi:curved DNA-binding protein CbpA
MDYFNDLDINPYQFLGVSETCNLQQLKDAFIRKASVIHPSKTNGKTEIEFKILSECYNFLKSNLQPKATSKAKSKALFVDHGIPQESELDSHFGYRNKIKKDYSPNDTQQTNMFAGESYSRDKFNAAFELHKEEYGCRGTFDSGVYHEPVGLDSSSSLKPLEIITYGGLIIEKSQKDFNQLDFLEQKGNTQSIKEMQNSKKFKNKLNKIKSKESALTQNEIQKLTSKTRKEPVLNTNGMTFDRANEEFYRMKVKNMQQDLEKNKDIIEQHLSLYDTSTQELYKRGLLEDSSTFIQNDRQFERF